MIAWEVDDVEQFIKALLVETAGTDDVFQSLRAGRGKRLFVVFQFTPRLPDVTGQAAGNRILSRPAYDIEVVTEGAPTDESEAMVIAISGRLKDGPWPATLTDGTQVTMERLNAISRTTPGATTEQFFTHRGGTYQAWVA